MGPERTDSHNLIMAILFSIAIIFGFQIIFAPQEKLGQRDSGQQTDTQRGQDSAGPSRSKAPVRTVDDKPVLPRKEALAACSGSDGQVPANRHQDRRRHRVDLPDRRDFRRPYAGAALGNHQEAGAHPPFAPRPHEGRLLCRHDLGGAGPERGHRAGPGHRLAGRPQHARSRQAGDAELDERRGRRVPPHLFDRPEIPRDGRTPGR